MRFLALLCLVVVAVCVYVGAAPASHPRRTPAKKTQGKSGKGPERRGPTQHGERENNSKRPVTDGEDEDRSHGPSGDTRSILDFHSDYRTDVDSVRCARPHFAGEGIPSSYLRDGESQCQDGSDEAIRKCNTESDTGCWECHTPASPGEGVYNNFLCDNFRDCADGSDEECPVVCDPNQSSCSQAFACYTQPQTPSDSDPAYVYYANTCDNVEDCLDGSDEYCFRSSTGEYGYCDGDCQFDIIYEWVCDGIWDSWNGRDEQNCFTCHSGAHMIDQAYVCDGYPDCGDHSDEICNVQTTLPSTVATTTATSWSTSYCVWGAWGEWNACSNTCGAGTRSRTRDCVCQTSACTSTKFEEQREKCRGESCPVEATQGCGTRSSSVVQGRIVGGEDAEAEAWPWQAQLLFGDYFKCGGTLYKDRYVISAAHCFQGDNADASQWTVHLGKLSTFADSSTPGLHSSGVVQIHTPPTQLYNTKTFDNDIVVLELSTPVPSGANARINDICVDTETRSFDSSSNCYISGYGLTKDGGYIASVLKAASVPLIPRATCNSYYGGIISSNMLCAGFPNLGGVDSCQGDSGGPLVCTAPDSTGKTSWYLVGVTSWGYGCASIDYPGVYTDVSKYLKWLGTF